MDNFTLAVLIGGLLVFLAFGALLVVEGRSKGAAKGGGPVKPAGKRSA